MADNATTGTDGQVVRTLDDGTAEWAAGVVSYATTVSAGANVLQVVTPTFGLPVALTASQLSALTPPAAITGFATSTLQTTGNTSLASLDTKTPALGQALAAASVPVVLTAAQLSTLTPVSTVTANAGTGSFTVAGNVASGASDSGNPVKVGGVYLSSAPTLTNAQRGDLQLDANGNVKVAIVSGGGTGGTASSFGSAFPATGTAIGAKDSTGANLAPLNLDASGYLKVNVAAGGTSGQQYAEDAAHASGDLGTLALVVRKDAAASLAGTDGDYTGLITDASGRLHVNVGNASLAVTGTFWQATQPVSAAALPLPSGAATEAKQPAFSTSGVSSVDVLTVQGIAGGTALPVSLASVPSHAVTNAGTFAVQATQAGTWTVTGTGGSFPVTDSGGSLTVDAPVGTPAFVRLSDGSAAITTLPVSIAAAVDVTPASPSATDYLPVRMTDGSAFVGAGTEYTEGDADASISGTAILWEDASDTLRAVSAAKPLPVGDGGGSLTVDGTVAATQSGTWNVGTVTTVTGVTTVSTVTNLSQLGGQAVAMGTGVRSAGTQRVTIATDDVVPAGQSGTWVVQPGNTANTTPWLVNDRPATSGGLSFVHITAAASNNKTQIKGTAGQLYAVHAVNLTATAKYIKLFNNTSAGVTAGTTNADYQFAIPANSTTGAGFVMDVDKGVAHSTAITAMVTGGVALNDNTAVAANDVVVTFFFA